MSFWEREGGSLFVVKSLAVIIVQREEEGAVGQCVWLENQEEQQYFNR